MTSSSTPATLNEKGWQRWKRGLRELLLHAVIQDRVLQRLYPGVMHFLIFWGVTIQILGTAVNLMQTDLFLPFELPFPRGSAYLWFELTMDLAGGMILLGALMALFRRTVLRPKTLVSRWDDWAAIALLLIIPILGFSAEAFRLNAVQPSWEAWSPIGSLFKSAFASLGVEDTLAVSIHQFVFWSHMIGGLIFIASIPFTKLRHILTGPLNILFRPQKPESTLEPIENIEEAEKLGVGRIEEFTSRALLSFNACVQCGRCEEVCPAYISGIPYSPRSLIYNLRTTFQNSMVSANSKQTQSYLGGTKETAWQCTTCGACLSTCPMFVNPVDSIVEMRRYLTLTTGEVPGSVGEALMGMERRGNPWSMPKESHAPWVKELGVKVLQPGEKTDVLLFIGCAIGYDARSQQAGRAFARLLQEAEVDFAVLGSAEGCCGETARRLGHEYLYQVMAEENIATFEAVDFNRIVTPCAHCFNTLKNEYPQFGGNFQVQHHTEFLMALLNEGKLSLQAINSGEEFSYHDSCYLGRYNQLYSQPRAILDAIPGMKRTEMERTLSNGFCCGGGGGQMWMETDPSTRINHRRLEEAMDTTNAEVVVTACPYCLIMFDDAVRSKGVEEELAIQDIAEVLARTDDS